MRKEGLLCFIFEGVLYSELFDFISEKGVIFAASVDRPFFVVEDKAWFWPKRM